MAEPSAARERPGSAAWASVSRAPPAGPGFPAPAAPGCASSLCRCSREATMTAGGRTCARVGSSPFHQPVGSTGLQTGKLRFRVYISWPRSQQELGFQPWQCKQRVYVEATILPETGGPPFSASLSTLCSSTLSATPICGLGSCFGSRSCWRLRVGAGR